MRNNFVQPQPRSDVEKQNVAAEAMGGQTKGGKPRAPRFHRMSITAAANGVSVDHDVKVPVKKGKTGGQEFHGSSLPTSGEDGTRTHNSTHVFGGDHPVMHHIHAIHKHIMDNLHQQGVEGLGTDSDGDSDDVD